MNTAFLLIEPSSENTIDEISMIFPGIKEVRRVSGDFPYMLRIELPDLEVMKDTIRDIRHSLCVKNTLCLLKADLI